MRFPHRRCRPSLEQFEDRTVPATIPVTNTLDDGAGSLRQAIRDANLAGDLDTIVFNIEGTGPHRISVLSALPVISQPVEIDGYTQPGATPATDTTPATLRIELTGSPTSGDGLRINAGGSTVRGLVINGFAGSGVSLQNAGGSVIAGNFIGTNAAGDDSAANARGVFLLNTTGARIGGASPADRNIISGNTGDGIAFNTGASSNQVLGNYIGSDKTGTSAVGNANGISIAAGGNNQIGGAAAGEGNLISGNRLRGVIVGLPGGASGGNRILGNRIGTQAGGSSPLPNTLAGVRIGDVSAADSNSNQVGGTAVGEGNVIAFNGGDGVELVRGFGNPVLGNDIFGNGGLGIDLRNSGLPGVTPNDPGDADTGTFQPNNFQNFPVLTAAGNATGATRVEGTLNSLASTDFRVELFANASNVLDPSGHGEGQRYLGALTVTTDAAGNAAFSFTPGDVIPRGEFITATATRMSGTTPLDTSEFSAGVVIDPNRPPTPGNDTAQTTEDATTPIVIDVLDNDSDSDGDPLTLVSASALNGQASVNDNGTPGNPADDFLNYVPNPDFSGTDTITYTVRDPGMAVGTGSVEVTVTAINDAPQSTDIPDQVLDEDTPSGAIPFTLSDVDTATELLTVEVTSSSNEGLIPLGNVVLGGSGANRTVAVSPVGEQSGLSLITLTIRDGSGGVTTETFLVTVNSVNDAPQVTGVADQVLAEDTSSGAIPFTLSDVDTAVGLLEVEVTSSSNPVLVPLENVVLGGSGSTRTVTVMPAADLSGSSTITLTVRDGSGGVTTETFQVTVNPVNDAPTFVAGGNQTVQADKGPQFVPGWATAISPGPNETGQVTFEAEVPDAGQRALFAQQPQVTPDGTLLYAPAAGATGQAVVRVLLRDDGNPVGASELRTFTITIQSSSAPGGTTTPPKGPPQQPPQQFPIPKVSMLQKKDGTYLRIEVAGQVFEVKLAGKNAKGPVLTLVADVTGDGIAEVIGCPAFPSKQKGVQLKIIDSNGNVLLSIPLGPLKFSETKLTMTLGDKNGDGKQDILLKGKVGGKKKERAFDGATGKRI